MPIFLTDLRFRLQRAIGLFRRGLVSLRTRGWRSSLQSARRLLRRVPAAQRASLYFPEPREFAPFALPYADEPLASIVMPVYNQVAHTVNCLRALSEHPPAAACEIIVVDDGSTDRTTDWLPRIAGLRFHRRSANGGFIAACNDGAAMARGEFLVFLNNDTIPQPGWLDILLETFQQQANAGLVGAQLLYPDGRLQEAGGIVLANGSAWNYGRFESPLDPRFAYLRECDYCSGAAFAIRRALFRMLGGFDTRYAPAYYEDTDLAFAVRTRGLRVLYQPGARVVHDEGTTSGTDPGSGVKAYQVRNRARLAEKWKDALALRPAPGAHPSLARLHADRPQVLIVDVAAPRPDHDSASLRLVNLMRLLRDEGAHVVFLPADLRADGSYTEKLQSLGIECWHAPFAGNASAWLRRYGHRFDTVMLSRHYLAVEFLPLVRRYAPRARVVFDSVDLHYLRERRGAEIANDNVLKKSAQRTQEQELGLIAQTDVTLVVSDAERQLLKLDLPGANVEVLSNLHEVAGPGAPFSERRDLLFVGGFRHPPNVDAVKWFVGEVFPRIRERLPDVRLHCIGNAPPPEIATLATIEGVHIHGHVPDIAPAMDGLRIALAPLRFGAGVKGKINLSMAHGQPVVATTCAVEGMHLRDGHDVLVGDDAVAFADAVVRLYGDEALWNTLSRNGLHNIARYFSLEAARATVRRVFFAPH